MFPMKPILTTDEAAQELGLSRRRVQELCRQGRLGEHIGPEDNPIYIIRRGDLERFAKVPRKPGRPKQKQRKQKSR